MPDDVFPIVLEKAVSAPCGDPSVAYTVKFAFEATSCAVTSLAVRVSDVVSIIYQSMGYQSGRTIVK